MCHVFHKSQRSVEKCFSQELCFLLLVPTPRMPHMTNDKFGVCPLKERVSAKAQAYVNI